MRTRQLQGILLAAVGAILWGVSGPIAQWLFTTRQLSLVWLIESKMLISGVFFCCLRLCCPRSVSVYLRCGILGGVSLLCLRLRFLAWWLCSLFTTKLWRLAMPQPRQSYSFCHRYSSYCTQCCVNEQSHDAQI